MADVTSRLTNLARVASDALGVIEMAHVYDDDPRAALVVVRDTPSSALWAVDPEFVMLGVAIAAAVRRQEEDSPIPELLPVNQPRGSALLSRAS